jgi:hypothetical protein
MGRLRFVVFHFRSSQCRNARCAADRQSINASFPQRHDLKRDDEKTDNFLVPAFEHELPLNCDTIAREKRFEFGGLLLKADYPIDHRVAVAIDSDAHFAARPAALGEGFGSRLGYNNSGNQNHWHQEHSANHQWLVYIALRLFHQRAIFLVIPC